LKVTVGQALAVVQRRIFSQKADYLAVSAMVPLNQEQQSQSVKKNLNFTHRKNTNEAEY